MTTPHRERPGLGALLLFASAAAALLWANVHPSTYAAAFSPLHALISDGLMALFFFVVGMELKHELATGALSTRAKALLPAAAAAGGMVAPALIFARLNPGGPGWGIPTATDIAFSVAVLGALSARVPRALLVFITALAVFDDLGGIVIIALFSGHGLDARWLTIAACIVAVLLMLGSVVRLDGFVYAGLGALLWYAVYRSGVHATLGGMLLGITIPVARPCEPFLKGKVVEPDEPPQLESFTALWKPWVTWVVLPLFALASAGVSLAGGFGGLESRVSLGVMLGLLVGKPLGIFAVTSLAVGLKLAPLPQGTSLYRLFAASVVAGVGFTVALFICALAYPSGPSLEHAKAGVLLGSVLAAAVGVGLLLLAPALPREGVVKAVRVPERQRPSWIVSAAANREAQGARS